MSSKVSGFQDKNGKVLKIMIEWWKEKFRRVVVTQNVESLLVSIVISAYNEEKYLPGLIEDLKIKLILKRILKFIYKCYVHRWDHSYHSAIYKGRYRV